MIMALSWRCITIKQNSPLDLTSFESQFLLPNGYITGRDVWHSSWRQGTITIVASEHCLALCIFKSHFKYATQSPIPELEIMQA